MYCWDSSLEMLVNELLSILSVEAGARCELTYRAGDCDAEPLKGRLISDDLRYR
jgi:hypothetical protein